MFFFSNLFDRSAYAFIKTPTLKIILKFLHMLHFYLIISKFISRLVSLFMKQVCLIFILILSIQCSIYQKYYDEGYSIAASMTLEEKIGQTVQLDFYALSTKNGTDPSLAARMHLGSLLVGGNGAPDADGNLIAFPDMDETKTIELYKQATLDNGKN